MCWHPLLPPMPPPPRPHPTPWVHRRTAPAVRPGQERLPPAAARQGSKKGPTPCRAAGGCAREVAAASPPGAAAGRVVHGGAGKRAQGTRNPSTPPTTPTPRSSVRGGSRGSPAARGLPHLAPGTLAVRCRSQGPAMRPGSGGRASPATAHRHTPPAVPTASRPGEVGHHARLSTCGRPGGGEHGPIGTVKSARAEGRQGVRGRIGGGV